MSELKDRIIYGLNHETFASIAQGVLVPPPGFNHEDMELLSRYEDAKKAFSPIARVFSEYQSQLTFSHETGALVRTAGVMSDYVNITSPIHTSPMPGSGELALFRIVAANSGKTTHVPTLRGTLQLAIAPETLELRRLLPLWLDELARQDIDAASYVQSEIEIATRALEKASHLSHRSSVLGYFTVPIGLTSSSWDCLPYWASP